MSAIFELAAEVAKALSGSGYLLATVILGGILLGGFLLHVWFFKRSYDVFLAIPMASAGQPEDREKMRQLSNELVTAFASSLNLNRIYCAWPKLRDGEFDLEQFALPEVLSALKTSKHFVLIYPNLKEPSSVLLEVGMAVSLGKPSAWFVNEETTLPFLMRNGEGASGREGVPPIRVYLTTDPKAIKGILQSQGRKIFGSRTLMEKALAFIGGS